MKYIKDWERILVDTTVLCSMFRSEETDCTNSRDLFVRKVMEFLSNNKTSSGKERIILISAITVAELTTNEEDSQKIKRILRVLDAHNVEFIDFDLDTAIAFNAQLKPYLNKANLNERAKEIGYKTGDYGMAREWITRDYMIAMSGITNNSDVILTADKNTFYPIVKHISRSNCVLTFEELFDFSDKFILKYKEEDVEAFLKIPLVTVKAETKAIPEIKAATVIELNPKKNGNKAEPKPTKENIETTST